MSVCMCVCMYVCVCVHLTKSPRGMGVIFLHRLERFSLCVCVCMCMYVCIYVSTLEFGTQTGLANSKVEFEDGLCESHRDS